jgi:Peptidase inhibitor family I36
LLAFTTLPAFAQYQSGRPRPPKTGACFYKEANFRGEYFCLKMGESWNVMPPGFNDRISSIRLFSGAQVRVFNDSNFRGVNARIPRDVIDLSRFRIPDNPSKNWNNRVSSISVYRANDAWDRSHP